MPDPGPAINQDGTEVDFCTLGMFILGKIHRYIHSIAVYCNQLDFVLLADRVFPDDIEFEGPTPPVYGILGGAASFAVVGARMVAGPEHGRSVSWILDVGSDFPSHMLDVVRSWDTGVLIREDSRRLTTRAWNGYGPNEKRG
jgi:hypothetical protein